MASANCSGRLSAARTGHHISTPPVNQPGGSLFPTTGMSLPKRSPRLRPVPTERVAKKRCRPRDEILKRLGEVRRINRRDEKTAGKVSTKCFQDRRPRTPRPRDIVAECGEIVDLATDWLIQAGEPDHLQPSPHTYRLVPFCASCTAIFRNKTLLSATACKIRLFVVTYYQ